ncbi:MAG TPA: hypothetical protein EYP41_05820, partial [Anaerolineae bacterium]|nr:hypothetical protein [Anaerolineae bacterium]
MPHSRSQTAALTCPSCGQPFDALIWLIVDVSEQPELLDRLREGKLHDAPCPHCGHDGQIDAPLLLYRPGVDPPLLFSPAQGTTEEQDQEQAAGLINELRQRLGETWREEWLAEGLSGVPRHVLPAALSDDPEAALRQMTEQAEQELERLRQEDPEAYRQLEEAARQQAESAEVNPLLQTLQEFIEADTWMVSYRFVQTHPELLGEEADTLLAGLVQAAQETGEDNAHRIFAEHLALLRRCRETDVTAAFAEKLDAPPEALAAQSEIENLPPAVREVLAELAQSGVEINSEADLERALAARPDLQAKLAVALSDDPEAALQMADERDDDSPETVPPLLNTLQQFIEADTWMASYRFVQAHPELLGEEADALLAGLVQAAQEAGEDNTHRIFAEHLALLRRCRETDVTTAFAEKLDVAPEALAAQSEIGDLPPAVREVLAELAQSGVEINSEEDLERALAARPDLQAKLV